MISSCLIRPLRRARIITPALACASLGLTALGRPVAAQTSPPAPLDTTPLPIVLPDEAKLQTEINGSDTDILGMVKGLLEGIADPAAVAAPPGKPGTTKPAKASDDDGQPGWMKILNDGELSDLLKNIHHLHFVSFSLPSPAPGAADSDLVAFYEKPLQATGGHRLLWQAGDPQILIESGKGETDFTAVYHSGDNAIVIRADGYPNMKVVGALLRSFLITGDAPFPMGGGSSGNSGSNGTAAKPAATPPKAAASKGSKPGKKS